METFNLLTYNMNLNYFKDIKCFNYGVGDKNNFIEFFRDTVSGGRKGSFIEEYVGDSFLGNKNTVKIKTLDFIITEYDKPNVIKIDVEGLESNVLKRISDFSDIIFLIELREETSSFIFNLNT